MIVHEQTIKLYERIRRSASPLHPIVRGAARISVRAYAKIQRFQLPSEQPYNYRFLTGMYEPGTTKVVSRLLSPGMIAIDVGAHVGYYARLFAKLVGKRGKVYAFEPNPETFVILEHNTKTFPNVNRFNMAVLDKEEFAVFYQSANSGANSLWSTNTRGQPTGSILVKTTTLDKILVPLLGDVQPHLIKVDVEGAELEVFEGMQGLISRATNLALIVEYNPSCLVARGLESRLLIETIQSFGFTISAIDETTGKTEIMSAASDINGLLGQGLKYINLLCTR